MIDITRSVPKFSNLEYAIRILYFDLIFNRKIYFKIFLIYRIFDGYIWALSSG